jgi:tetratricopeptide (TPR) repeat protein
MRKLSLALVLATVTAVPAAANSSKEALDAAKSQYEAAAYEEALAILSRASDVPEEERAEFEQYRAFCLIALGNMPEAERAVAALVEADPTYLPSKSVASPKVLAMVSEIRAKELPAVARRVFDAGRVAYKEKNFSEAREQFDLLLTLLKDPAMEGRPETQDMLSLAEGFVTLVAAATSRPAPAAPPPPAAAAPAKPAAPPVVVAAVPLREALPPWVPPNNIVAASEYSGSLKIRIGADGRVLSASIERASHPAYDARLLQEARFWVYKPATRDGTPIESEKLIDIRLRPR